MTEQQQALHQDRLCRTSAGRTCAQQADESAFLYAPSLPVTAPTVAIVTVTEVADALLLTAESIAQQSLQGWRWLIVAGESSLAASRELAAADDRIRVVPLTLGADGELPPLASILGGVEVGYVAIVQPGTRLAPTTLEKWLWFLVSHEEFAFVDALDGVRCFADVRAGGVAHLPLVGGAMIRAEVLRAARGHSGMRPLVDPELWRRCARLGYWGGTVRETLVTLGEASSAVAPTEPIPRVIARPHTPNEWVTFEPPFADSLAKTRPRLLLVIPSMAIGGADKVNLDVLDGLGARGWETTVASTLVDPEPGAWLEEFRRRTPDVFHLATFLRVPDYPRFLTNLVRSRDVDVVVFSNSELGYRLLPYLRATCPDTPFVDLLHSEVEYWNSGGYPRFSIEYHEQLDLTLTVSKHLREWMASHGGDRQRIEVCYAGVDTSKMRPDAALREETRRTLGIADATVMILFVGRVSEEKQPRVLAQTLAHLASRRRDFVTVIAGDGPELPWLRAFIRRRRLGRVVRILGAVTHEEVRSLMNAADVFFLPSMVEGIALTVYEAMASGLPVVAADVGGQHELVDPSCGILISPSDPETEALLYASALAHLIAAPERRRTLAGAAQQRVETEFNTEHMQERISELLDKASQLHRESPRALPSLGLARATATEAVECTRLELELLWTWRRLRPSRTTVGATVRVAVYRILRRLGGRLFRWSQRHDLTAIDQLKRFVDRKLLGA